MQKAGQECECAVCNVVCVNITDLRCGGGIRVHVRWGSQALLIRPTAAGKKLVLWGEVSVLMDRSLLLDGKDLKEFVTWVGGIGHNLTCPPQGPRGEQVLKRWKIAANHLLGGTDDTLQSAFVIGSGSSVPDRDGGGEDGLDDAGDRYRRVY